jgi:hypothetical protein
MTTTPVARMLQTICAAAAVCLLSAFAQGTTDNLVKNGSFERPALPPGNQYGFGRGFTINHWRVLGLGVDIVSAPFSEGGFSFPAKLGHQWLNLAGGPRTGIEHTFDTTPDGAYTLSFYVGNVYDRNGRFGTKSTVIVLVDGVPVYSATNSRGKGQQTIVWQKFTTTITATSSKTKIEFKNGDSEYDLCNGLDGVKLVLQNQ